MQDDLWRIERDKIIGLGENSSRKNYYPELQEKEDQLYATQKNLETIINSISDAIILHKIDGSLISANKKATQLFNLTNADITTYKVQQACINQDSVSALHHIWETVLNGTPRLVEWKFKKINLDEIVDVQVSIDRAIRDGEYVIVAVIRDFSERKKYENLLKMSEERFRKIFEKSGDAVFIVDEENKFILNANNAAIELTGRSLEILKLTSFHDLYIGSFFEEHENIGNKDNIDLGEIEFTRPDGSSRTAKLSIRKIDEKLSFVIANDVTESIRSKKLLERQNQELKEVLEKVNEMDRLKNIFFVNMSHELRTPLVGLLGFSEILEAELEGDFKDFAQKIHVSGKRLLDTLNGILKYSEIEANMVQPKFEEIDLAKLIEEEIALYNIQASQKGLNLFKSCNYLNYNVVTDEKLIRGVCSNIISNAIKYTEKGHVSIGLFESSDHVELRFEDTGIGIPKDKYEIIFQEFRQVSEGISRFYDGSGLGLAIVKKYVELLGASIKIESEIGLGSTFKIGIPISKADKTKKNQISNHEKFIDHEQNIGKTKKNILIVDDESINIDVVKFFIKDHYNIDTVSKAKEVLALIGKKHYDIILMDINLKDEIDGIQLTQQIKLIQEYKAVPVIAMTAFAMKGDKEKFLDSGCTHYISKPFTKKQLLQLLDEIEMQK